MKMKEYQRKEGECKQGKAKYSTTKVKARNILADLSYRSYKPKDFKMKHL